MLTVLEKLAPVDVKSILLPVMRDDLHVEMFADFAEEAVSDLPTADVALWPVVKL